MKFNLLPVTRHADLPSLELRRPLPEHGFGLNPVDITKDNFGQIVKATDIVPWQAELWRRKIHDGKMDMLVLYDYGRPAGRVNVMWEGSDERAVRREIGEVPVADSLHVNPENNRGIFEDLSSLLLKACEGLVRQRIYLGLDSFQRLATSMQVDDEVSRALYENACYEPRKVDGQDWYIATRLKPNPSCGMHWAFMKCCLLVKELGRE